MLEIKDNYKLLENKKFCVNLLCLLKKAASMNGLSLRILWFLILIAFGQALFAQKIVNASGKAKIRVEMNKTQEETYKLAEQQAKINAINKVFGMYVGQQGNMNINNGKINFNIIGTTKVRGEWIETKSEKFIENVRQTKTKYGISNFIWITCIINGKVRRCAPRAEIEYHILNAPDIHSISTSFQNNGRFYVYFKSPVNGYLSIFLEDKEAVYRLLPYMEMRRGFQNGVPVKSDTDYLFFSPNHNLFPEFSVDEPRLCIINKGKNVEYDYIYIVFSEDKYVKPILNNSASVDGMIIPKQLSHDSFQKWLSNNRVTSESFQSIKVPISIRRE